MTAREQTHQRIRDNMAGYLTGLGLLAAGPPDAPNWVTWPTGFPPVDDIKAMIVEERSLYTTAWLAALHDAVLELAERLDR